MRGHVLLIAGPTASGKSALAMRVASEQEAVIVNADSMQIYRDLRILSARPSEEDEAQIPHRLYGVLDGAERCSAGRYARLVAEELAVLGNAPVVIVGGTGLYFRALTEGLSLIPEISKGAVEAARERLAELGPDGLHGWLLERDPDTAAGLRPSDPQRLMRAVSVLEQTGEGLAAWQSRPGEPVLKRPYSRVVLEAPRAWAHERVERRLDAMVKEGAFEEVRALLARKLDPSLPVMKAVGVPEFIDHLQGLMSLEEALTEAKTATRRFVKRQDTWFRNQMGDWPRLPADGPEKAFEAALCAWQSAP